jgi:aminoglycoside phosphotransferase (APT) family kinase protein
MTAEQVLKAVRIALGDSRAFRWGGQCPGGEVGAHYAVAQDGHRLIFKWSEDAEAGADLSQSVARVERLRAKGYPAPRHYEPVVFEGGVAVFQNAVAGAWSDEVDDDFVGVMLDLNDLQQGEGDESKIWRDFLARTLTEGANGYCVHATLRDYSTETRRVLQWIREVGRSMGELQADDLVHLDFHHRNRLRTDGGLSAVIDWEGCIPGDRAFDLVTFSFGFTHAHAMTRTEERVWRRAVELASLDRLAAYVAHMSLRRLDWTIRHHPGDVDRVLNAVADRRSRVEGLS